MDRGFVEIINLSHLVAALSLAVWQLPPQVLAHASLGYFRARFAFGPLHDDGATY